MRVAEEKTAEAPECLESLSWFCSRKKKVEIMEKLPGFCEFVEVRMMMLSEPSWTQTAAAVRLLFLFLESQLEEIYCSKSTEM